MISGWFGSAIKFVYDVCGDYGWAIVIFTLLIKIVLLPLGIKQQKSMAGIQKIQPKIEAVQKKYKNDKERLNQEIAKIYQQEKINPMGGCLPMLIQLPILWFMIQVIYNPAKHVMGLDVAGSLKQSVVQTSIKAAKDAGMSFIFEPFGLDLSYIPSQLGFPPAEIWGFAYWIIPILAAVATYVSSKTIKSAGTAQAGDAASSMNTFNKIMPLITLIFAFTMPGTAALYWFVSSAFQTVQQICLNKFVKADDVKKGE